MKKPPGPCVSCPITPCLSGIRSSSARASKPPGRKLDSTASHVAKTGAAVGGRGHGEVEAGMLRHLVGELA